MDLLPDALLSRGFAYPSGFLRVVECGLTRLDPWHIYRGDLLRRAGGGLCERYPSLAVVPFAWRQDNDDVACWLVGGRVVTVHDYADEKSAVRDPRYGHFDEWFRAAIEEFLEFRYDYPNGYVTYANRDGQRVDWETGRTIPNSHPRAHMGFEE